jgi:hypothetical protein
MNSQAGERELEHALAAALREQAGAERYERSQRQLRRGKARTTDAPRPLEFDENGFPVAQRRPSFVTRVARLLSL